MQDMIIRSLPLTGNCMQSEGELRFCTSLYEILVKIRFQKASDENFCNSIEEYDPQMNEWEIVREVN